MPIDWENNVIVKKEGVQTRFCSVQIDDPASCFKFFGKYHSTGDTIMVCEPTRSSCSPYIVVPDGCIAVLLTSGAYVGLAEPGMMCCLPFTETKYLVSKQDFVYEAPDCRVITADNLSVDISLSLVLKVVAKEA